MKKTSSKVATSQYFQAQKQTYTLSTQGALRAILSSKLAYNVTPLGIDKIVRREHKLSVRGTKRNQGRGG